MMLFMGISLSIPPDAALPQASKQRPLLCLAHRQDIPEKAAHYPETSACQCSRHEIEIGRVNCAGNDRSPSGLPRFETAAEKVSPANNGDLRAVMGKATSG